MKIGILGGGQLAQMLTQAAIPLGFETLCYEPSSEACANRITSVIHGAYDNWDALKKFADAVDVVTYETENIPLNTAEFVAARTLLAPNTQVLKTTQDRVYEKILFQSLNIPTTNFQALEDPSQLSQLPFNTPCVLKTRRLGYDGKGQAVIKTASDFDHCKNNFTKTPSIVEEFIAFDREVSLIGVRSREGEIRYYPLTENTHEAGILRISKAPYADTVLQKKAEQYLDLIFKHFNYCGVLTVEFFQRGDELIANEIAPRVHNTGHWTIEGAHTSQFENHIRAITGLPLGSTTITGHVMMWNLIGEEPAREKYLRISGLHYHSYGKAPRPHRKLGHMTLVDNDLERFEESLNLLNSHSF